MSTSDHDLFDRLCRAIATVADRDTAADRYALARLIAAAVVILLDAIRAGARWRLWARVAPTLVRLRLRTLEPLTPPEMVETLTAASMRVEAQPGEPAPDGWRAAVRRAHDATTEADVIAWLDLRPGDLS